MVMMRTHIVLLLFLTTALATRWLSIPGVSEVTIALEEDVYRVSFDNGIQYTPDQRLRKDIHLIHGVFDPLVDEQPLVEECYTKHTSNVYMVQFETAMLQEYRDHLEQTLGFSVLVTLPHQAALVYIPKGGDKYLQTLEFVRWVGPYYSAYKLPVDLRTLVAQDVGRQLNRLEKFSIMVAKAEMQPEVTGFIQHIGGKVTQETTSIRFEALLTVEQLLLVLERKEVLFADVWTPVEEDMDIARIISGATYVEAEGPYVGEGIRAEVCDGGLRTTHNDFSNLNIIIHGSNSNSLGHGTPVFGINFGDGSVNAKGKGLLFEAEASIFSAYGSLGNRLTHTRELVDPNGQYRAVFQTNSWGSAQTEAYTTVSAEMDSIIFETDLLILQSQSNTGNKRSRPQAWAKNILSIGGVRHYDTLTKSDDRWAGGASIGPAADGRLKPELTHFYDQIYTTAGNSNTGYTQFGGTSGATPITSGHAGLTFEMWADGIFTGNPGVKEDPFEARCHSATAKALMINTADQYPFNGANADLSRFKQGWGMVNVGNLYDQAVMHDYNLPVIVDEDHALKMFEVDTYTFTVKDSGNPTFLQATLNYRDPAGTPGAAKALVNDITLKVTSPSGVVYHGNNAATVGLYTPPGGSPDDTNNLENVAIENAEAGEWKFEISGDVIVEDAYPATPDVVDAAYAFVVTSGR